LTRLDPIKKFKEQQKEKAQKGFFILTSYFIPSFAKTGGLVAPPMWRVHFTVNSLHRHDLVGTLDLGLL
jgi:hypothetical protein